jgi:predicted  nucleic acid-binding Zn-ribbon protein
MVLLALGELRGEMRTLLRQIEAAESSRAEMRKAIEDDINALREEIKHAEEAREKRLASLDTRVSRIEKKMVWAAGAAFPLGLALTFFSERIISWLWPS